MTERISLAERTSRICSRAHRSLSLWDSTAGRSRQWLLLGIILLSFGDSETLLANPTLEAFSPRSVKIGSKTEITATGKFGKWPVTIWSQRPGLSFEPGAKGKFTVTASNDAAPGTYLIRFIDQDGASEPIPLVVDALDSVTEKEPNESPKQSQAIMLPANISGVLGKSGDVDCYAVDCEQGQTLVAKVTANPWFGTTVDAVIQICDSRGFVMDQNDDSIGVDPRLTVQIPDKGKYFIRVFAFPAAPNSSIRFAGGADYRYLLTVTNHPLLEYVVPWSSTVNAKELGAVGPHLPANVAVAREAAGVDRQVFYSRQVAGFFELPQGLQTTNTIIERNFDKSETLQPPFEWFGAISQRGQIDLLQFQATKGKKLRFQIESRRLGMEMDPQLTVFDQNGKALVNKDDNSKTDPDLTTDFKPALDGTYILRIRDAADNGGDRFHYRVSATEVQPGFHLELVKSSYDFAAGAKVEIEVNVNRTDGFSQPIEIEVAGLPNHVIAKAVKSESKGESAKKVKLIVESKQAFQAECRIVGKSNGMHQAARFSCPSSLPLEKIFLTARATPKVSPKK